jgi:hypothetical protein
VNLFPSGARLVDERTTSSGQMMARWNGRWRSSAPDHLLEPTKGLDGLLDCGQRQGRREKGGITKRHQLSTATAVICFVCVLPTDFMRID